MPASSRSAIASVDGADPGGVLESPPLVQAVGHRQRLAVIRDGDVLEAARARGRSHRRDVLLAVGLGRVHVQVAAQVRAVDQTWKLPGGGGVDLAPVFAKLRRNPRQAQRLVDAFLGLAGHRLVALRRGTGRTRSA